jgi:hypothetical protein
MAVPANGGSSVARWGPAFCGLSVQDSAAWQLLTSSLADIDMAPSGPVTNAVLEAQNHWSGALRFSGSPEDWHLWTLFLARSDVVTIWHRCQLASERE